MWGVAEELLKLMAQGHRFFQILIHHTTVEHPSLLTLPPCQDSREEHSWKKCMKTCLIRSLKSPREQERKEVASEDILASVTYMRDKE